MSAFHLRIFIFISVFAIFASLGAFDLINEKILLIGEYNNLIRWLKRDAREDNKGAILHMEPAILHVVGNDYTILQRQQFDILPSEQSQWHVTNIMLKTHHEQMSVAIHAFYATMKFIINDSETRLVKAGVCQTWFNPRDLLPHTDNLFLFMNNTENEPTPAWKLINESLAVPRNEKGLKKSFKGLSHEETINLHQSVRRGLFAKLQQKWINVGKAACGQNLPQCQALFALDQWIVQNELDRDECLVMIQDLRAYGDYSLEVALHVIDTVLSDKKFLNSVFGRTKAGTMTEEYVYLRKIDNAGTVGILSLASIRDLILHDDLISLADCQKCSCVQLYKLMELTKAKDKVRSLISTEVKKCSAVLRNTGDADSPDFDIESYLKTQKRAFLSSSMTKIRHIDNIFEIFNTNMKFYYKKPYIGIPFSKMPVKHGLWWLASLIYNHESCDQYRDVQNLIARLEQYSQIFYNGDHATLHKCGLTQTMDVEDSFAMVDKMRGMLFYEMIRTMNFTDLTNLSYFGPGIEPNMNLYEVFLWNQWRYFVDDKLLPQLRIDRVGSEEFATAWIHDGMEEASDATSIHEIGILLGENAVCELLSFHIRMVALHRIRMMNYEEGRILPFQYEKPLFLAAFQRMGNLNTTSPLQEIMQCEKYVEAELKFFVEATRQFVTSEFMRRLKLRNNMLASLERDLNEHEVAVSGAVDRVAGEMAKYSEMKSVESLMVMFRNRLQYLTDTDRRSIFKDFEEFEDLVMAADNTTSTEVRDKWSTFIHHRSCFLRRMGIYNYETETKLRAVETGNGAGGKGKKKSGKSSNTVGKEDSKNRKSKKSKKRKKSKGDEKNGDSKRKRKKSKQTGEI